MAWVTAAELQAYLEQQVIGETLTAEQIAALPGCLSAAEQAMRQLLAEREFSPAQQDAWSGGAVYQRDIATYFFLRDYYVTAAEAEQTPLLDRFDRRLELAAAILTDATGALLEPEADSPAAPALVLPDEDQDDEDAHDYPTHFPRGDQQWPIP
jgi:hypothetical protein